MKNRGERVFLTWMLILSVVSLSIPIAIFAGYGVTASLFVLFYYLIRFQEYSLKSLAAALILISFLLLNALASIIDLDAYEFLKSFGLTVVFIICYSMSFGSKLNPLNFIDVRVFLAVAISIVVGYQAVQLIEQYFFSTTQSWFFLDNFSISTATDIGRFEAVNFLGYYRPVSLYHEPSYLGIVLLMLLIVNNNSINSKLFTLILMVAIFFTMSMVAIIFTSLYAFISFFADRKFLFIAMLIPIVIAGVYWMDLITTNLRLDEVFVEGTSGWMRIILPFEETISILKNSLFGNALGQNVVIFDNSFFLFFVYFGAALPFLFIAWIFALSKCIGVNVNLVKYLVFFSSLIFLNGAIFTPESTLLLLIVTWSFFDLKLRPTREGFILVRNS